MSQEASERTSLAYDRDKIRSTQAVKPAFVLPTGWREAGSNFEPIDPFTPLSATLASTPIAVQRTRSKADSSEGPEGNKTYSPRTRLETSMQY